MLCDQEHPCKNLLMPSICHRMLCTFAFEELGLMADVGTLAMQPEVARPHVSFTRLAMAHHLQVVNLLLTILWAACRSSRHSTILDPFPSMSNPKNHDELALDPDKPDVDLLQKVFKALPCPAKLSSSDKLDGLANLDELPVALVMATIRWYDPGSSATSQFQSVCLCFDFAMPCFRTVASNRSYLVQLPPEAQLDFMGTSHQFLMLVDSPAKEQLFQEAKLQHGGSVFLFQYI